MSNKIAYAEVDAILELIEDEYLAKIPIKIRQFFKEEKEMDYIPKIDTQKSLLEQNLKRETFVLLTILELNYWCDSEEEKEELIKELHENEEEMKKELYEKYNPDNIFKKRNNQKENLAMIEYKEPNFIKRILDRIKRMFRRK